jgi:ankyrin repeat protein
MTGNELSDWINSKTFDDGFTALHFASFRGNIDLLDALLNCGANIHLTNNFGINVVHVAA